MLLRNARGVFRGGGHRAMAPPFWSEKYENSLLKRVFINIFVILGGRGPDCGQSRTNFTETNPNYENFQIILEELVDELHQI